jgi:hypothetical protein
VPALSHHVVNIVLLCAQKEMIRIRARWIIAPVEYPKVIGDRAKMDFIRDAMSRIRNTLKSQIAVSARATRTFPFPTFIIAALFAPRPESICQSFEKQSVASGKPNRLAMLQSCVLTASALALAVGFKQAMRLYPGWILRFWSQVIVMIMQKDSWKAANLTQFGIGNGGNRGIFSATTLAFAIWLYQAMPRNPWGILAYVFGKGWGMITVHQNLQFWCQAQDVCRVAGQLLLGCYSFIIPHFEHFGRAWIRRRADLLLEASK